MYNGCGRDDGFRHQNTPIKKVGVRGMKKEEMMVAVVDGQGGGVGRALVEQIRRAYPTLHVRALGTNSMATAAMLKAGATDGATGENAIVYNAARVQVLLGPVAILVGNGLLGEVTPAMATAVGGSDAVKILLPSQRCNIYLTVGERRSTQAYIDEAVGRLEEEIWRLSDGEVTSLRPQEPGKNQRKTV